MKKILTIFVFISIFFLAGCGTISDEDILKKMEDKLESINSYYIVGSMEIINNEDTYTYDIEVSYAKGDYYKVDLINTLNNHEQVILRNDEGVYVMTHKSFQQNVRVDTQIEYFFIYKERES